jgi:hypothetical protein
MAAEEKPKKGTKEKKISEKTKAPEVEAAKIPGGVEPSSPMPITPPVKIVEPKPKKAATPKSVSPKASTKKSTTVRRKKGLEITVEQIQLRAYFIAERRRNLGIAGNETSDWVQAERELRNEIGK